MDDEHRVVQLLRPWNGETPDAPVTEKEKDWTGCPHVTGWDGQAIVDEDRGVVTCRDCGVTLDPFRVLIAVSRHYRSRIEAPLREYRMLVTKHNENERAKFFRRVERHRKTHPTYVGTCRTCYRLETEAGRYAVTKLDEVPSG